MNYVRYLVNINCLKLKDISSSHIQVWNSDRVRFLPQRKWCDRNELYLESQVSEGNPSSEGICQSDKEWASPGMEGVASSFGAGCVSEFPSGHSFTIVCTKQCKSWEGVDITMQKQKLHCWFQTVLSWESTHLCRHPTVDKVRICWMKARGQRQVVNYLSQWNTSFLENLW